MGQENGSGGGVAASPTLGAASVTDLTDELLHRLIIISREKINTQPNSSNVCVSVR